jgi:hypothetical protein
MAFTAVATVKFAKKKGQSRSGFLVEAARTAMHA